MLYAIRTYIHAYIHTYVERLNTEDLSLLNGERVTIKN